MSPPLLEPLRGGLHFKLSWPFPFLSLFPFSFLFFPPLLFFSLQLGNPNCTIERAVGSGSPYNPCGSSQGASLRRSLPPTQTVPPPLLKWCPRGHSAGTLQPGLLVDPWVASKPRTWLPLSSGPAPGASVGAVPTGAVCLGCKLAPVAPSV